MKLKRTVQCKLCPWRKDVDPHNIPNGYDVEKHKALDCTISDGGLSNLFSDRLHVMACHETQNAHCIGWLVNQMGRGNNIALRLAMRHCENANKVRTIGEQHDTFEETLP